MVIREIRDRPVWMAPRVDQGPLDLKEKMASQDYQAKTAYRDCPDRRETLESQVSQVKMDNQAKKGRGVWMAFRADQEKKEIPVFPEQQEKKEIKDRWANAQHPSEERREKEGETEETENLGSQDPLDLKESPDLKERRDFRVKTVALVSLDRRDATVSTVRKERQDRQGRRARAA